MQIFVFGDFEVENGEQCVPVVGARLLPLPQGLQLARGEQAGGHQVRPQHLHLRYHNITVTRFNSVILAADHDVLTPKAFQQLAELHNKVNVPALLVKGLSENADL